MTRHTNRSSLAGNHNRPSTTANLDTTTAGNTSYHTAPSPNIIIESFGGGGKETKKNFAQGRCSWSLLPGSAVQDTLLQYMMLPWFVSGMGWWLFLLTIR